jgi:hypothetical protein
MHPAIPGDAGANSCDPNPVGSPVRNIFVAIRKNGVAAAQHPISWLYPQGAAVRSRAHKREIRGEPKSSSS